MNRYFSALFSVFIFSIWSCKDAPKITTTSESQTTTSDFFTNPTQTIISAHRGGSGLKNYPENCIETMEYLYDKGIRVFEIDITETQSGEFILLHDDFLDRTTTGNGKVKFIDDNDLKKLRLVDDFGNKTNYKIPSLAKALDWILQKETTYFMIDFKKDVSYQKVIELIREKKVEDKCILISYSTAQAKKLYQLAPEMRLSVGARNQKELDRLLETDIPTQNMIAFTGTKFSEQSLYDQLKELKIPAILGTLGNLDKRAAARGDRLYKQWAEMGISIFATDRPLEAYQAVQK